MERSRLDTKSDKLQEKRERALSLNHAGGQAIYGGEWSKKEEQWKPNDCCKWI